MEVEITETSNLTERQENLLGVHSFINLANIILAEVRTAHQVAEANAANQTGRLNQVSKQSGLNASLHKLKELVVTLQDPSTCLPALSGVPELEHLVLGALDTSLSRHNDTDRDKSTLPGYRVSGLSGTQSAAEIKANVSQLFAVFKARAEEFSANYKNPLRWIYHDIALLKIAFFDLFHAVERNSKGRFRIVYNVADQEQFDYLIHFDIRSVDGSVIYIPAVLHDIIRDLILNARKYTPPGGRITAGLSDNGRCVRFVVEDTGIGIPESELRRVVDFGYRGSNVGTTVRQYGGGFGLTKAFIVTKKLGGRFWIDSAVGHGTRIKLEFPILRPA